MSMYGASVYHCNVCGKQWKKFLLFEGHFTFNLKCRVWNGWFMQCYLCNFKFRHLAELKYHLRCHKNVIQRRSSILSIHDSSEASDEHQEEHSKTIATSKTTIKAKRSTPREEDAPKERRMQRQFLCRICKANCYNKVQLEKHMSVHTHGTCRCEICKIRFSKISLAVHNKKCHPEMVHKKRFECEICNKRFKQRVTLDNHLKLHFTGNLTCNICHIRFTKHSLTSHIKRSHPELLLRGSLLPPIEQSEESVVLPSIEQSPTTPFLPANKQSSPSSALPAIEQITDDQLNEKTSQQQNAEPYECKICKFKFTRYTHMRRHMQIHISGEVKCDICNIHFTENTLIRHNILIHSQLIDEESVPQNMARQSLKEPIRSLSLSKRRVSTTSSKQSDGPLHQCNICETNFTFAGNLMKHMDVHTLGKVKCRQCNINFTPRTLAKHEKRFHPELGIDFKPNKVQQSKQCESLKNAEHNLNEQNVANISYQCKICKIFCSGKEHLAQHKKHHQGVYKCKVCNIRFTKQSLWRHVKQAHPTYQKEIKITKLACNICPITCPTQRQLDQHMKVHINGEYQCAICQIPFTRFALVLHRARFHPELKGNTQVSRVEEKKVSSEKDSHRAINNLIEPRSMVCYVCNKLFPTVRELKVHMNKHKIHQQWIDPSNVYLSNWSFEKAQEILQNQPLVLVENLDIKRINLKSLSNLEAQREYRNCESDQNYNKPLNEIGNIETGFNAGVIVRKRLSVIDLQREFLSEIEKTDEFENYHKQINQIPNERRDPSPIHTDINMEDNVQSNVEDDCVSILEVSEIEELEELPISEQRVDSTTLYDEDKVREDVIDITSDDDDDDVVAVDDTAESFYCYFCNGVFRSLNQLGTHVNVCPQSMI